MSILTRAHIRRAVLHLVPAVVCRTYFRDRAAVLAAARVIEPDSDRLLEWFAEVPIRQFGDRTGADLVGHGEAARLIEMLHRIGDIERDLGMTRRSYLSNQG
jgi:hypothetical protein